MEDFTLADLGVFLGVVGGIITSILLTIQKSKCEKIKCCGKECCERKVKLDKNGETLPTLSTPRSFEPEPERV